MSDERRQELERLQSTVVVFVAVACSLAALGAAAVLLVVVEAAR